MGNVLKPSTGVSTKLCLATSRPPYGLTNVNPYLTLTQHSDELDMACYRISDFDSTARKWDQCPLSGRWPQQEDSTNLVFHSRGKLQMMNILKTLIMFVCIYGGDAMLFNRQKYSEPD